jgi:hypothetical protein
VGETHVMSELRTKTLRGLAFVVAAAGVLGNFVLGNFVDETRLQAVKFESHSLKTPSEVWMRFFKSFSFVTVFVASVVAAASFDPPKRKSGLWEVKISIGDARGGPTIQECVDEKTDDLMTSDMPEGRNSPAARTRCEKRADRIVIDSVCKVNGSTAKARNGFHRPVRFGLQSRRQEHL